MDETNDDFPKPDIAAEFRRRQLGTSDSEKKRIGAYLFWTSLAIMLITVSSVGVGMILPHGGVGDMAGIAYAFMLRGVLLGGIGISVLLSFVSSFYYTRAIALLMVEMFVLSIFCL